MKKYIVVNKKPDDFFYPSFGSAKKDANDDEIIIEVEVKELRRFKKGGWQEIKGKNIIKL